MAGLGWRDVQATVGSGISEFYQSLHHVENSHQFNKVLDELFRGDPLVSAFGVSLLVSLVTWALGIATNKHSWVDKLWSILPVYYLWHFAVSSKVSSASQEIHPRLLLMAVLQTVWGARLTYNFARKGGYRWTEEDYRWPIVRSQVPRVLFEVFALVFIAFIQNVLLLAITAPAYVAWQRRAQAPLNWLDAVAGLLVAGFILMEGIADQQQWEFQTAKHAKIRAGKRLTGEYAKGFLTTGLFRYSRHPNFFAEQALWWSLYLFSVAASGKWINWSMAGVVGLTALFQGSTRLTEQLTAQKYPKYRDYQQTTYCLFPWWPLSPQKRGRGRPAKDDAASPGVAPPTPGTPRRRGRKPAAAPGSPDNEEADWEPSAAAAGAAPQEEEDQEEVGAPAPTAAASRRSSRRRVAAAEQGFDSEGGGGGGAGSRGSRRSARAASAGASPRRRARGE
ncbi:hypothetical protein N2152v2_009829 [Parachlorella kessleri]